MFLGMPILHSGIEFTRLNRHERSRCTDDLSPNPSRPLYNLPDPPVDPPSRSPLAPLKKGGWGRQFAPLLAGEGWGEVGEGWPEVERGVI